MDQILQTERLILRKLIASDSAFIIELLNTPGWLKYIGDRNVRTTEEAENYILNGPVKSFKEHGFGLALILRREDNCPIGMCGLLKRPVLAHPDIGFALIPAFTGRGYAFEITQTLVQHAKFQLRIQNLSAIVLPSNSASVKLLGKLGFESKGPFVIEAGKEPLLLFEREL